MKRIMLIGPVIPPASAQLLFWVKINRATERSDHHHNVVLAADGVGEEWMVSKTTELLKTLKIISHRATHLLPFKKKQ